MRWPPHQVTRIQVASLLAMVFSSPVKELELWGNVASPTVLPMIAFKFLENSISKSIIGRGDAHSYLIQDI